MNSSLRIVLILLVGSLLAGVATGSTFYYRLGYVWIFVLGGSWIMAKLSLRGIRFKRTARFVRSQVGQVFEERFELMNTSRIPRLWLEVRDKSALSKRGGSQVLSLIGGEESRSYLVRTRLQRRGIFPLGRTIIAAGDVFGLFPVSRSFPASDSLLVFPMMVDVQTFPSPLGWLSGGESLRRRTQQITPNAAGVREYAPGDPLSRIHWLSTARRNRLMVKEFELDPLAEVWIFLDANRYVQVEGVEESPVSDELDLWRPGIKIKLPPSTEEYSVSIAASLARYYLQLGRVVGFVSAGERFRVLSAERGARQMGKILETLALLRADGRLPLQGLVEAEVNHLPRGSTVILITPERGKNVMYTSELLQRRGMRPVVVMVDAMSFEGTGESGDLAASLGVMQIPIVIIKNGDDIGAVLSSASRAHIWD